MKHVLQTLAILIFVPLLAAGQDSLFVRQNYTKHEYRIAMRDGVNLFTVAYVPNDGSEAHPIMITRTPYSVAPYGPHTYFTKLSNLQRKYFQRGYIKIGRAHV